MTRVVDVLALLVVLAALLAPARLDRTAPETFARIPVEVLLGGALLLLLPTRPGRVLAAVGGAGLGLLTLGKALDTGFHLVLGRPFDPVTDRVLVGDGLEFLSVSAGGVAAAGAAVGALVLAVAGIATLTLSALRTADLVVRHRATASIVIGALVPIWVTGAVLDVRAAPDVPLADRSTTSLAYDHVVQVRASMRDERAFAAEVDTDPFAGVPGNRMLTGLRGKNVLIVFVESYGRSALEDPRMAPQITPVLDAGTATLEEAGFGGLSGWMTSPTYGGSSWLAHSTLLSGLWVDNQGRYRQLVTTERLTLTRTFRNAGWRTVGVEPAIRRPWPEGSFFGYSTIYDCQALQYRGPGFGYSPMPDQYVLSTFQHRELAHATGPVMGEIVLTSSHLPWTPLPDEVPWQSVGDGSVFGSVPAPDRSRPQMWTSPTLMRTAYARSIRYSLNALVSYLRTYGDDDTVLVLVGDHQPSPVVTDNRYGRDVPITVLARDPTVLQRVAGWGWTPGLRPAPKAPVWPMSAFRDRFLTAFGPQGLPTGEPAPAASGAIHAASGRWPR